MYDIDPGIFNQLKKKTLQKQLAHIFESVCEKCELKSDKRECDVSACMRVSSDACAKEERETRKQQRDDLNVQFQHQKDCNIQSVRALSRNVYNEKSYVVSLNDCAKTFLSLSCSLTCN